MLDLKEKAIRTLSAMSDGDKEELKKMIDFSSAYLQDIVSPIYQKDFERELRELLME